MHENYFVYYFCEPFRIKHRLGSVLQAGYAKTLPRVPKALSLGQTVATFCRNIVRIVARKCCDRLTTLSECCMLEHQSVLTQQFVTISWRQDGTYAGIGDICQVGNIWTMTKVGTVWPVWANMMTTNRNICQPYYDVATKGCDRLKKALGWREKFMILNHCCFTFEDECVL